MFNALLRPPVLTTTVSIAVLLLRVGFGGLMIPIGYDKLLTFLAGDHDFPDPLHVSPVVSQALTIFAEFFCAILIVAGLFSRLASAILVFCMLIISLVILSSESLADRTMALLFLTAYLVIGLLGPGKFSVDARLFK